MGLVYRAHYMVVRREVTLKTILDQLKTYRSLSANVQ